jgi:hypothetical protein
MAYANFMVGWLLRATVGVTIFAALGYLVVSVPVGRKTLFEHSVAISKTRPARELVEDVRQAASDTAEKVREGLDRD